MSPLKKRFIELFEASGWNQAEVARRLSLTRGGVNRIVTGAGDPSESTVEHLKLLIARDLPEVAEKLSLYAPPRPELEVPDRIYDGPAGYPDWAAPLIADLEALEEKARPGAIAACISLVSNFPKRKVSCGAKPKKERPAKAS